VTGTDKTLGVGVIGFGFMGKVHSYGYLNLPLFYDPPPCRVRLVGVCTSRPETAEKAKAMLGFDVATTDPMALIARDDIDVIHVCTPNVLHKDVLLAAMAAGKHIYCDKPITATVEEAREVESALADYHGTAQMTFNYRFVPATLRAKQLIDEGFLGPLTSFRAAYLHSGSVDPDKAMGWKQEAASGGGILNDLASHIWDLMEHLTGRFDEVFCSTRILYPERPSRQDPTKKVPVDAEDLALLVLRRDDGFQGTLEASKIATGIQDELRFEIHGRNGTLAFNLMEPNWLRLYDVNQPGEPVGGRRGFTKVECVQRYPKPGGFPGPKFSVGWIRFHMACLHNFLDSLSRGEPAEPGLRQGVHIQEVLEKARESARGGGWVRLHT